MFRVIWLIKRKSGSTPQQFRDYHEKNVRPLGEKAMAGYAYSYERYYLYPFAASLPEPIYDVVVQATFPDRDTFSRCLSDMQRDPKQSIFFADDELNFLDREASACFEVYDSFSKLQALPINGEIFRTICFARHRNDTSHDECRAYYENKHRLVGEYVMNGFACNYDRHYLRKLALDAAEPHYTFMTEMNFPSRALFEQMGDCVAKDPTLAQFIAEDERRFLDRDTAVHYAAEASISPLALPAQVLNAKS